MKTLIFSTLILGLFFIVPAFSQSTPTSNFFTFFPQQTAFVAGSAGNSFPVCVGVTGINAGTSQSVNHSLTTILKVRFGLFGTLNSASNFTLEHEQSVSNPVTASDFSFSSLGQNVIITYTNPTDDHNFAFHDKICFDANLDAPLSSSRSFVDYTLTLNSGTAQEQGIIFSAK